MPQPGHGLLGVVEYPHNNGAAVGKDLQHARETVLQRLGRNESHMTSEFCSVSTEEFGQFSQFIGSPPGFGL